jgi:hypothetical protein
MYKRSLAQGLIIQTFLFDKALVQFINSTRSKYREIARLLKLLRLNLLIKYSKENS